MVATSSAPRRPAARDRPATTAPNALGRTLLTLGDHRNLNIIQEAFQGARRFGDWQRRLDISDPVLSGRLRALVDDEILQMVPYSSAPPRHEYRLTARGRDLWRVFVALWAWERRWVRDSAGGRRVLRHDLCGKPCNPLLGCANCGAVGVTPQETSARVSDDSFERSNPTHRYRRAVRTRDAEQQAAVTPSDLLGDRWSMSLLASAFLGRHRFTDFQQHLATIPPLTLADRLDVFVEQQLLDRVPISDGARRMEYRLTPKGFDFFPALASIVSWTNEWVVGDGPAPIVIEHTTCGADFHPVLVCNACGERLTRQEIRFDPARAAAG